jgi:adenylosuccinate lyase
MTYQSPFTNRYGSDDMRMLWSEASKRRAWRRVWVAVAEVQAAAGLISAEQIDDIKSHAADLDLSRAYEIEAEIGHDLMAELKAFAEKCESGGAVLHWGLTSADVQDNAAVVLQKAALALILKKLRELLLLLADRIEKTAAIPIMGYTHLQPATPTTLGYRLAFYAQDLLSSFDVLARLRVGLKGKGIKGAVGTAAPFIDMLQDTPISHATLEATVMQALGIESYEVTNQTYPRLQDYQLMSGLGTLAASMHKFAFDLRLMQSPGFRAASEPFGEHQVGSSAMPFKRNPVKAEKICSLARHVAASTAEAWQNASLTLLERTLDDSANRRRFIPESFLACDEMLHTAIEIVEQLEFDERASERQFQSFAPFSAIERILTALVRAGADRQEMHERLRQHSLTAWEAIQDGKENPLSNNLTTDTSLLHFLQPAQILTLLDATSYIGLAPEKALALSSHIRERLQQPTSGTT